MIGRFLGRFPRTITVLILGALAASIWQATVYIETVVWPRQAAEREALIAREIARADKLFSRDKFDTALSEYEYVLTGYGDELAADVEGVLRDRVGTCLVKMAEAGTEGGSIERGIESYRAALALSPPETHLVAHTEIQYRIGDAYMTEARKDGDPAPIEQAVAAFEGGLAALSAEENVALYATGLRLVGNAHRQLHELDPDANPLDNAMRHYEEALRVAGPIDEPITHGETLMEVSRAYILLAEQGYRHRQLKEAIKNYEKVLRIFTVEDYPRRHAGAHKEMGDTYTVMSKLGPRGAGDRAAHQQRVIHYENKAKQSYRIAKSFGLEPGFQIAGAEEAAPVVEEEKKE